jgi:hypothetical protein
VLRLSDRDAMAPAETGEEVVRCALAAAEATRRLCEGVDAILHFGGRSLEGTWPEILSANITGGINLWAGARLAGVASDTAAQVTLSFIGLLTATLIVVSLKASRRWRREEENAELAEQAQNVAAIK